MKSIYDLPDNTPRQRLIRMAVMELTFSSLAQWLQREVGVRYITFLSDGTEYPTQLFELNEDDTTEAWKMVEQLAVYGMGSDVKEYYNSTTTPAWNRLMATVLRLTEWNIKDKQWWFATLVERGDLEPVLNQVAHIARMNNVFAPWVVYDPQVKRQPTKYTL